MGNRIPASRDAPGSWERSSQHVLCPAELSSTQGPPWGGQGPGTQEVTRRSCPSSIRRHRAHPGGAGLQNAPISVMNQQLPLFLLHWRCLPRPHSTSLSLARVIHPLFCSGGPAPSPLINSANARLTGRQRQGRGRRLRQADNHGARPTQQGRAGETWALCCIVALDFFFLLYVPGSWRFFGK